MKKFIVFFIFFFISLNAFSQSYEEIIERLEESNEVIKELIEENESLKESKKELIEENNETINKLKERIKKDQEEIEKLRKIITENTHEEKNFFTGIGITSPKGINVILGGEIPTLPLGIYLNGNVGFDYYNISAGLIIRY